MWTSLATWRKVLPSNKTFIKGYAKIISMRKFSILAVILILTSCATAPAFQTQSTYDRDQVSWSFKEGTGKIEGDGFLMRRDGMLVKCAGQGVFLVPVSEYSIERFTFIYGTPNGGYNTAGYGRRIADDPDPVYVEDHRSSFCDVDGKFTFDNLPAGEYFVQTAVIWQVNDYVNEGGTVSRRVKVEEGKTSKVSLTY